MKRTYRLLWIAVLASIVLAITGGVVFVVTHPRCEVCGRRYGPLMPHPYSHYRHHTTRAAESARQRATAPVINSLPPLTDANKDLTLTPELLVGRWESQDGDQMPLLFDVNGTVEWGALREDGHWLMSKGTYHIEGDRVIITRDSGPRSFDRSYTFARGVLYASQISVGEENSLKIRIYGETCGLEWAQMEPNTLQVKWINRPIEMLRTGGALSERASFNTRLPAGHPEGYIEAFANIYRSFFVALRASLQGREPDPELIDYPTIQDGVRGMAFIETVVEASKSDKKWTKFKSY